MFGQTPLCRRQRSGSLAATLWLGAFGLAATPAGAAEAGPWGPVASLRDDTATHPDKKPAGGWYVAPIHVVLQARDGKVILSGTERIAQESCNGSTQRNYGVTIVLDPAQLDASQDGATLQVLPLDEAARDNDVRDVLYCSGQIPLADGRVLYVGGTQYPRILPITSPELGLDYARVFARGVRTLDVVVPSRQAGEPAGREATVRTLTEGVRVDTERLRYRDEQVVVCAARIARVAHLARVIRGRAIGGHLEPASESERHVHAPRQQLIEWSPAGRARKRRTRRWSGGEMRAGRASLGVVEISGLPAEPAEPGLRCEGEPEPAAEQAPANAAGSNASAMRKLGSFALMPSCCRTFRCR